MSVSVLSVSVCVCSSKNDSSQSQQTAESSHHVIMMSTRGEAYYDKPFLLCLCAADGHKTQMAENACRLSYDDTSTDDDQTLLDISLHEHKRCILEKITGKIPILVRVLQSGINNHQAKAFTVVKGKLAVENPTLAVTFECLSKPELIKKFRGGKPKDLVDWLLKADVHYILGHIHQGGVFQQLNWSVHELYTELKNLGYHPGSPRGLKIDCPIGNQDKIYYIESCSKITNPTLAVQVKQVKYRVATDFERLAWYCLKCKKYNETDPITEHGDSPVTCENCAALKPASKKRKRNYSRSLSKKRNCETKTVQQEKKRKLPVFNESELEMIKDFCSQNNEGFGWVVKAPFTTNSSCRFFASSHEKVISSLESICVDYGPNDERDHSLIPYVLIQPCMKNFKEYKVVVFNGEPLFVLPCKKLGKRCTSFCDDNQKLLDFAKSAVQTLTQNCRHAIVDGLIRVDIFCNAAGEWKVNEFEGYEADFGTHDVTEESLVVQYLESYWESSLRKFVYLKW